MSINRSAIALALQELPAEELKAYMMDIVPSLDDRTLQALFGPLYKEFILANSSDDQFLSQIQNFVDRSYAGQYYDSKYRNTSLAFNEGAPLTMQWYEEISFWIDAACARDWQVNPSPTAKALDSLIELIEETDACNDTIIVAQHDGSWNITVTHDYLNIRAACQQLENQQAFKKNNSSI